MLPFLPPEIILNIIRLSLPPATYTAYRERYDLLLIFSLVNRSWRSLAQCQLFEPMVLSGLNQMRRLSISLREEAVNHAGKTRSLLLGGRTPDWTGAIASEPWTLCRELVEIQATGVFLPFESLSKSKRLRRLHLHKVVIIYGSLPVDAEPLFHHLTHLTLSDLAHSYSEDWAHFIRPSVLPALRSLLLAEHRDLQRTSYHQIVHAVHCIGGQLASLSIMDDTSDYELEAGLAPSLPRLTALETLVILGRPDNDDDRASQGSILGRPDLYSLIPSPLKSLEIIAHSLHSASPQLSTLLHLVQSIESNAPSLRSIERISIPPPIHLSPSGSSSGNLPEREEQAVRSDLKSLAAARPFVLDETGTHSDRASAVWFSVWTDLRPKV